MPASGDYRFNPLDRYLGLPDPLGEVSKKPTYDKPTTALSQDFLQKLQAYNQQFNGAFADQDAAARGYGDVIAGGTPSVAQAQLVQGLGSIQQGQQAAASGATGQNAAIARIAAMQTTGQAQAQANQQAALLRAQEIAQARAAQAQIYGQQADEAQHGAIGFAAPTAQLTMSAQAAAQKEFEDNRNFWANLMQSGGRALVGGIGGGGAGAAAGSSGSTMGSGGTPYGTSDGYMGYGQSG